MINFPVFPDYSDDRPYCHPFNKLIGLKRLETDLAIFWIWVRLRLPQKRSCNDCVCGQWSGSYSEPPEWSCGFQESKEASRLVETYEYAIGQVDELFASVCPEYLSYQDEILAQYECNRSDHDLPVNDLLDVF